MKIIKVILSLFFLTPILAAAVEKPAADDIVVLIERNGTAASISATTTIDRKKSLLKWQLFCNKKVEQKTIKLLEPLFKRAIQFLPSKKLTVKVYDTRPTGKTAVAIELATRPTESTVIELTPLSVSSCSQHFLNQGCTAACFESSDIEHLVALILAQEISSESPGVKLLGCLAAGIGIPYLLRNNFSDYSTLYKELILFALSGGVAGTLYTWFSRHSIRMLGMLIPHRNDRFSYKGHFLIAAILGNMLYSIIPLYAAVSEQEDARRARWEAEGEATFRARAAITDGEIGDYSAEQLGTARTDTERRRIELALRALPALQRVAARSVTAAATQLAGQFPATSESDDPDHARDGDDGASAGSASSSDD